MIDKMEARRKVSLGLLSAHQHNGACPQMFDQSRDYGGGLGLPAKWGELSNDQRGIVLEKLHKAAVGTLPEGTDYEVRMKPSSEREVFWYSSPAIRNQDIVILMRRAT